MLKEFFKTFFCFALMSSLFANALPAAAQTRRAPTTNNQPPTQSKASCSGAWSGIVRYRRIFEDSFNENSTNKNYSGAYTKVNRTQSKEVAGSIVLDGKRPAGVPDGFAMNVGGVMMGATAQTGRTNVTFTETMNEATQTAYRDSCGWETREKKCQGSTVQNGTTMAETNDTQFMLEFQGDRYGFRFHLPGASGTLEKTIKQTCTGYCNGGKDINENYIDAVRYDRESVSVKDQKLDPQSPDRLKGTSATTSRDGKTSIIVSWNLRRCAPPLQLIDLFFQEHRFPNNQEWVGMSKQRGTIDGNRVRVVARVLNTSTAPQTATVNFSEARESLPQPNVAATVAGGEVKDIEYIWDTRGFAWEAGGTPVSDRQITVKMNSETLSENVAIKPKPVVLIGGYWTKPEDFRLYEDYLKRTHIDWTATPVGSFSGVSKAIDPMLSIGENARQLEAHIRFLRERMNAWHVDAVAHSTGGLVARYYVHQLMKDVYTNRAEIAHLVMLGTPNNGTPCADIFRKNNLIMGRPTLPMSQLQAGAMEIFNRNVYKRNRTRFSALAGTVSPITCVSFEQGDGFTPLSSATYNIDDAMAIRLPHQALTSEHVFKNFVKERLSLSPAAARAEETMYNGRNFPAHQNPAAQQTADALARIPATWQASAARLIFSNPMSAAADEMPSPGVTLDTEVKIPAGKSSELDVPILAGARAAVVIAADANVSATLTDASGKIIGTSAGAKDVEKIFRTIEIEKPSTGNFRLRLENAGAEESVALVAAWTDIDPLQFTVSAGKPNAAGLVPLEAKLTKNDAPVNGAVIKAIIIARKAEILFFDDGKHGDGAAGDGVYGAATEKLPAGDYWIRATAETNGQTRAATVAFSIGGAAAK